MSKDRQFEMEDGNGAHLVCWLQDDRRLRVGIRVTLQETGKRRWRILWRSKHVVDDADLNRHWHVGGL